VRMRLLRHLRRQEFMIPMDEFSQNK